MHGQSPYLNFFGGPSLSPSKYLPLLCGRSPCLFTCVSFSIIFFEASLTPSFFSSSLSPVCPLALSACIHAPLTNITYRNGSLIIGLLKGLLSKKHYKPRGDPSQGTFLNRLQRPLCPHIG